MIGRLCLTANLYNQNSPLGEERERERECVCWHVLLFIVCLYITRYGRWLFGILLRCFCDYLRMDVYLFDLWVDDSCQLL